MSLSDKRQAVLEAITAMLDEAVTDGPLTHKTAEAGYRVALALTQGADLQCAPWDAMEAMLTWARETAAQ